MEGCRPWRPIFLPLALAVLLSPASGQEIKSPSIPPPLAKTGTATIYLNEPAEVTLTVAGRIAEPMKFLIRKRPRSGDLGEVRRTGRNTAVVTYTPHAGAVAADDAFAFAAQSADSPVSAPATVWIRLVERPPVLEYPGELDFGTVYLGDTASRELPLGNSGGGRAIGQMRANPPWQVEGSPSYQILSGTVIRKKLLFSPGEERDFSDRLVVGGSPKDSIVLRGSAVAPIAWPKAGLVLSPEMRASGEGALTLTNRTPDERVVAIQWPAGWTGPAQCVIPGGATTSLPVAFSAPLKKAWQGTLPVQSENFSAEIPLQVFPKPAGLRMEPGHQLDLEPSADGKEWVAKFVVANSGEADGLFAIEVPEGCLVSPDPGHVVLGGGETIGFVLTAPRFQRGPLLGDLVLKPRSGTPLKVPLAARPNQTAGGPAVVTAPPTPAPAAGALPVGAFLSIPQKPLAVAEVAALPPVGAAELRFARPHEIEFAWKIPSPDIVRFEIQRRQISSGKGNSVAVEWIPWTTLKIRIDQGMAIALIENLADNTFWTVRIIGFNAAGQAGPPSVAFQIGTPPSRKFHVPGWVWWGLALALAGGMLRLSAMHRRRRLAAEDERLARLQAEAK